MLSEVVHIGVGVSPLVMVVVLGAATTASLLHDRRAASR
jgi:hypothetical protein